MGKLNRFIFLIILFVSGGCSYISSILPYSSMPAKFDRPQRDGDLQSRLEEIVADLGLQQAVHDKRLTFAFADLADLNNPIMAGVNESNMMYAASLPKICILLGVFKRVESGELEWTKRVEDLAIDMNANSSNTAATELFHLAGPKYIMDLMITYKLYDQARFGGLWIGKEYGKGKAVFTEPIAGTNHGATPFSVLRFYYLLETGQLLNERLTQEIREVLAKSAFHTKFQKGVKTHSPGAILLRKAGSWRNFSADGALVLNEKKRYVLAGFADDPNGEEWLEKLGFHADKLAKDRKY